MKVLAKSSKDHIPELNIKAMKEMRAALMPHYDALPNTFGGMTKTASDVNNLWHRVVITAGAWGLSEDEHAMYIPYAPGLKADQCYTATYAVPANDEFWSITIYDSNKYLVSNNANSLNQYNTTLNEDGTFTAYFGSVEQCGNVNNRVDTVDNWNSLMRAYRPDVAAFKQYQMPDVVPAK